jgi:hypothetical protein
LKVSVVKGRRYFWLSKEYKDVDIHGNVNRWKKRYVLGKLMLPCQSTFLKEKLVVDVQGVPIRIDMLKVIVFKEYL